MKKIKELQLEIEELKKQIKELKNQDYQEIKYNGKIFRIYKWENKEFKDFPIPKGFHWCEYFDFIELINEEEIKLEEYPIFYYTKNQFKNNIKKGWELSRVYFDGDGNVYSDDVDWQYSDDDGRVVVLE